MLLRRLSTFVTVASVLALGESVPKTGQSSLGSISQVLKLSNQDAEHGYLFHLRAQVTLFEPQAYWLFLQDASLGIYALPLKENVPLRRGDWIEVEGVTARGAFAPILDIHKLKVISNGPLPVPVRVGDPGATIPESANVLAIAQGRIVRSEFRSVSGYQALTMDLKLRTGGELPVLLTADTCDPNLLVEAEVVVHGILGTIAAGAGNRKSDDLLVLGCKDIDVITSPHEDWSLPPVALDRILTYGSGTQIEDTVHVHGVVTLARWDHQFSIQQGKSGILVEPILSELHSRNNPLLRIGASVDVLGRIIQDEDGFRRLVAARVRPLPETEHFEVQRLTEDDINKPGFAGALVCAQGVILSRDVTDERAQFGVRIGALQFIVELPLAPGVLIDTLPEVGDRIEVLGVARLHYVTAERGFDVRLEARSPGDIKIIEKRALLERIPWGRVSIAAGGLALGALIWVFALRNRVNARTRELVEANEGAERARTVAENANRVKSQFLANMSHEIRTPMNGILGAAELMLETELSAGQKDLVETARFSAEGLLTILDDILDSSKIEAGKLELDFTVFPLRTALENAMRAHAVAAQKKGLRLLSNIESDVPEQIISDPTRLAQVLTNLIGNAIKFTSTGEVEVSVELDNLTDKTALLHFSVRDTGIGIAASKLESIFEAFSQADASTTRKFGGTGLGLTISSKLIEMLGGRLWVESELHQGSCFHFTTSAKVPVIEAPAGPAMVCANDPGDLRGLRILLAEDNLVNQKIVVQLLRKLCHSVTPVFTGRAAFELFQRETFDLILMDVQMPEMDGFEATAAIRGIEKSRGEHTPIIALTAHAMVGDRERCLAAGMDGYASKPIRIKDLISEIGRLVRQPGQPV